MGDGVDRTKDEVLAHLDRFRAHLPPPKAQELTAIMLQLQRADPSSATGRREAILQQLNSVLGPQLFEQLKASIRSARAGTVQRPPGAIQPPPGAPAAQGNVAHFPLPFSPHSVAPSPSSSPAPSSHPLASPVPPSPSPSPLPIANALRPAPPVDAPQQAKRARTEGGARVAFVMPSAPAPAPSAAPPAAEKGGGEGEEGDDEGGGGGGQSVKALMDVTRIAGVDLKMEAQALDTGADDEDEAGRVVLPESLVLGPELVRPLVLSALHRTDAAMRVDEHVHQLVAHAAHERLRSLVEQLVVLSAHRHEAAKGTLHVSGERDPKRTLKQIEKREREAKERREEEERERALREAREQEAALRRQKGEGTAEALQETRERLSQMKTEDEEVRRTKSTNTTASLAIGERRKVSVAPVPIPLPSAKGAALPSAGAASMPPPVAPALSMEQLQQLKALQELIRAGRQLTPEQNKQLGALQALLQRRPAPVGAAPQSRRITKRDLLALLASDPHSRTSRLVLAPRGKLLSEK